MSFLKLPTFSSRARVLKSEMLQIAEFNIKMTRKPVKHLRLVVDRRLDCVRVSVPSHIRLAEVQQWLTSKLDWIRQRRAMPAIADAQYISGEQHLFQGKTFTLQVVAQAGKPRVEWDEAVLTLKLYIAEEASVAQRANVVAASYRAHLQMAIPALLAQWQSRMNVSVLEWRIRQMKTRWGSCNPRARRIWLNVELAKHPSSCLEYVLVHELTHLLEASHNARFKGLLDQFMPDWRVRQAALRGAPPTC